MVLGSHKAKPIGPRVDDVAAPAAVRQRRAPVRTAPRYPAMMAIEHGQYGHYPALERRRFLVVLFALAMGAMAVSGCVVGLGLSATILPAPVGWWAYLYLFGGCALIFAIGRWVTRWMTRNEQQYFNYRKGADGESATAEVLQRLPNTFHVFHSISLGKGDIDHAAR